MDACATRCLEPEGSFSTEAGPEQRRHVREPETARPAQLHEVRLLTPARPWIAMLSPNVQRTVTAGHQEVMRWFPWLPSSGKLIWTAAKITWHTGYLTFPMAEFAVPREFFAAFPERLPPFGVLPPIVQSKGPLASRE
jgi:hypothetical protein